MSKRKISLSNPEDIVSLVVNPEIHNGKTIRFGGKMNFSVFAQATNIDVSGNDVTSVVGFQDTLVDFNASKNKITNIDSTITIPESIKTFNLRENLLTTDDIDTVLTAFGSQTAPANGVIDISGFGNAVTSDDNNTKIAALELNEWTVNRNANQYTISSNVGSTATFLELSEGGEELVITIARSSTNIPDGTEVPYTISGIQSADLVSPSSLTGSFTINNNSATATFNIAEDIGPDAFNEAESFILTLNGDASITIPITDTTLSPYALIAVSSETEGESFDITISTVGITVPDGTTVDYTITGIQSDDITGSLTGRFILTGDTDTITISTNINGPNDENETMVITLDDYQTSASIRIFDRPSGWSQLGLDIDGEVASDNSGMSVSMNSVGDRVAIGAHNNDGNSIDSGHVRIYEYSNSTWTQIGDDIDGEAARDNSGFSVSMNSDGDRVAIGAYGSDDGGVGSGHVRIYEYSNHDDWWTQIGDDIDGDDIDDGSGRSVSMNADGDRIAIGAPYNDDNGNASGHVRIYEYIDSTWTQVGTDIGGEDAGDLSGNSVSMNANGDRVAIGAHNNADRAYRSGHTRIYEYDGANWVQLGLDIDGEGFGDISGYSVSINAAGDRVAIGAPYNDGNSFNSGHTRIYEYSNGNWSQIGGDIDGEAGSDYSGRSVSINDDGDRVAIGAYGSDDNGYRSGHVRIYEYSDGTWTQVGADIDGEAVADYSGYSVSMNSIGNRVAIGSPLNDDNGVNSGHTRIYEF